MVCETPCSFCHGVLVSSYPDQVISGALAWPSCSFLVPAVCLSVSSIWASRMNHLPSTIGPTDGTRSPPGISILPVMALTAFLAWLTRAELGPIWSVASPR